MDANEAIKLMVASTGKSMRTISGELGMRHTYVKDLTRKPSVPRADTLARIADACGFDLVLVPRNGDVSFMVIDPPEATS